MRYFRSWSLGALAATTALAATMFVILLINGPTNRRPAATPAETVARTIARFLPVATPPPAPTTLFFPRLVDNAPPTTFICPPGPWPRLSGYWLIVDLLLVTPAILAAYIACRLVMRRTWAGARRESRAIAIVGFMFVIFSAWLGSFEPIVHVYDGTYAITRLLPFIALIPLVVMTTIRTRRDNADPSCAHCGYCLRGLTSARCPECGTSVDVMIVATAPASLP